MQFSSHYLEQAVDQLASLPGVGRRTALRLALDLLKRSDIELNDFISALSALQSNVQNCLQCGNITDTITCQICDNPKRDKSIICVVEDIRDVMAIESTNSFEGIYHVLGGLISPMDGIGPQQLNIASLPERIQSGAVKEIILALSPTMEGDTTNFYIYKKIKELDIIVSRISRGIAVGSELQYADELTLGRSLQQRQLFELTQ